MSVIYCVGIMTGTSCDGADLSLLAISGNSEKLLKTASAAFPSRLRGRLRFAQRGSLNIRDTAILTREYSNWLGNFCKRALRRWKVDMRRVLISIHGQTVWHEPSQGITVQLLDPAAVGRITGLTVTCGFRSPDVARNGEGAPLVPYYHWLRAEYVAAYSRLRPFAIHNVGGIANLTYVTKQKRKVIAFDTGPGNALIDMAVEKVTKGRKHFDSAGRMAKSALGSIDWPAIHKLARHPYFKAKPPKSTGRELFNEAFLRRLPGKGTTLIANATALTAHTMAKAYANFILNQGQRLNAVFIAGGGAKNPTLLSLFQDELRRMTSRDIRVSALPVTFAPPQALESMAFARFGFEALLGRPVSLANITGADEDSIGAGIFPGTNYRHLLKLVKAI